MSKKKSPIKPPYVFINAQQKTGGKTTFATFTIDALTLNGVDTRVQQIDDQRRLSDMLGSVVEDLRPSREAVFEDSTILSRALVPFYNAACEAAAARSAVVLDVGANEVEILATTLTDVGYDEDMQKAGLTTFLCVPFLPRDPELSNQAAFTIRQLRAAVPHSRLLLIENRHGGSVERVVPGFARRERLQGSSRSRQRRRTHRNARDSARILGSLRRRRLAILEGAGPRPGRGVETASSRAGRGQADQEQRREVLARHARPTVAHRRSASGRGIVTQNHGVHPSVLRGRSRGWSELDAPADGLCCCHQSDSDFWKSAARKVLANALGDVVRRRSASAAKAHFAQLVCAELAKATPRFNSAQGNVP